MEDNARAFLQALLFDGKSFLEREDEIEWVDEWELLNFNELEESHFH